LEAAGLPPTVVSTILGFQAALRAGAFDLVTGDVARLSGKLAESSLQFLVRALGVPRALEEIRARRGLLHAVGYGEGYYWNH
jgi:hypothetical protein